MNLSVVGLGKLGLPLAAVLAAKGFEVHCSDVTPATVDAVNAGRAPFAEPRLQEFMDLGRSRLSATLDTEEVVRNTAITFVVVPTPSKKDGSFSLRLAVEAARPIGRALAKKTEFHVVVMTSTVMPGDMEAKFIPELERVSGKRCGVDFGVCYNPEFIALGSVIDDMLEPDFVLIGESDPRAGAALAEIYPTMCDNAPAIQRMNLINAELAKISVNTFVTTKISYANMIAQICEQLPGADVDVVTDAIGLDSRIGRKYLKGAVSYGGPCFPRDNRAFVKLAADVGVEASIARSTDEINDRHIALIQRRILALSAENGAIAVLGLSYKPGTHVIEESAGLKLALGLIEAGQEVVVYDPMAMDAARAVLTDKVTYAKDQKACVADCAVCVIMTPWAEFRTLGPGDFRPHSVVIDCWHMLSAENFGAEQTIVHIGVGPKRNARPETASDTEKARRG